MRPREFLWLGGLALFLMALLAPAGLAPGWVYANFGDLYAYHIPLRHSVAAALQEGRLPFWNPYIFSGLPLLANPQSALFYPPAAVGTLFPLCLALSWDAALHLLWAALGVALLARAGGLRPLGAGLLGCAYALAPFLVYRVAEGIPTLLAALAWAPWCWLFWLRGPGGWLAACWTLQMLSGHAQFLLLNAAGMAVWAALRPERRVLALLLVREGAAALMLGALQWLPTWEFLGRSVRLDWPREFSLGYSLDWAALAAWLHPGVWGTPLDGSYAGPPSVFFETTGVFLGLAGLGLAAAGLWKGQGRGRWAAAVLMAAGVVLALGKNNPLYQLLVERTSVGFMRTPSRMLLLSFWGLLLAAGSGWRWLERRPWSGPLARLVLAAAVLLELAQWDRGFLRGQDARPFLAPRADVARVLGQAPQRALTDPDLANPNKTVLYRAMNVNGYEAFYLRGYPEYVARSEGRAAADPSRTYLRRPDTPEMNRLGVAWSLSADGTLRRNPRALPLVHFEDPSGRPLAGELEVFLPRPERWRALGRAPEGARRIVAALPTYPGWHARLNGAAVSLEPEEGPLLAAPLPSAGGGLVELDLDFVPSGWPLWLAFSAASWAAWLASRREAW